MEALLGVIVVFVAILLLAWQFARGQTVLETWAAANGLRVIDSERRWIRRGPFFWRTVRGQEVFYVTVEDADGRVRHAYVRCGGWVLGLLSDQATAEWVD